MSEYILDLRKLVGHRPLLQVGASVLLEDEQGRLLLQRRADCHLWGYHGGSVELDEVVEEAARRELWEETGIRADSWTDMGLYYPAAAYSDEKITMYLAQGLHMGEQHLDDDEFLNVELVPIEDVVEEIVSGRITDGKTQAAVLKASALLKKQKEQET